jgi:hypothetical protein
MSLKQELEKKKVSSQKLIWIASSVGGLILLYGLFSYFGTTEEVVAVATPTEYTIKK